MTIEKKYRSYQTTTNNSERKPIKRNIQKRGGKKKKGSGPAKRKGLFGQDDAQDQRLKAQRRQLIFGKQKRIPPNRQFQFYQIFISQAPYLVKTLPKVFMNQFHRPFTSNLNASFSPFQTGSIFPKFSQADNKRENISQQRFSLSLSQRFGRPSTQYNGPVSSQNNYMTRQQITAQRIADNIRMYNNSQGPSAPYQYYPFSQGLSIFNSKEQIQNIQRRKYSIVRDIRSSSTSHNNNRKWQQSGKKRVDSSNSSQNRTKLLTGGGAIEELSNNGIEKSLVVKNNQGFD